MTEFETIKTTLERLGHEININPGHMAFWFPPGSAGRSPETHGK